VGAARDSGTAMVEVNQRGPVDGPNASRPHRRGACPRSLPRGAAVCSMLQKTPAAVPASTAKTLLDLAQEFSRDFLGEFLYRAKDHDLEWARLSARSRAFFGEPPQKRGRRRQSEFRDFTIATAVATVAYGSGFSPTRSHATHDPAAHSACSIIQAALAEIGVGMSERTVEGIWERHKNLFAPRARP
jgi:hypothetical protein